MIKNLKTILGGVGSLVLAAGVLPASAMAKSCDRACLTALGEQVLQTMPRKAPGEISLSYEYKATLNNVPQALSMMSLYRTVTAIKDKYLVVDSVSKQVFIVATVTEGASDTLLYGRIKIDRDAKVNEVELNITRSRGDAGFQYGLRAPGWMAFPNENWTGPIKGRKATREELLLAGRSIFDPAYPSPQPAETCVMMENGQASNEDPEVLKYLIPSDVEGVKLKRDKHGMDIVPCAVPPERPADKRARVIAVDEENGIVVATAMMSGINQPYLVESPTTSAFVPTDIGEPYYDVLAAQAQSGKYTAPRVRGWPVTANVTEMYRIYDGKIQGMTLLFNMQPYGSTTPWVPQGK